MVSMFASEKYSNVNKQGKNTLNTRSARNDFQALHITIFPFEEQSVVNMLF